MSGMELIVCRNVIGICKIRHIISVNKVTLIVRLGLGRLCGLFCFFSSLLSLFLFVLILVFIFIVIIVVTVSIPFARTTATAIAVEYVLYHRT